MESRARPTLHLLLQRQPTSSSSWVTVPDITAVPQPLGPLSFQSFLPEQPFSTVRAKLQWLGQSYQTHRLRLLWPHSRRNCRCSHPIHTHRPIRRQAGSAPMKVHGLLPMDPNVFRCHSGQMKLLSFSCCEVEQSCIYFHIENSSLNLIRPFF